MHDGLSKIHPVLALAPVATALADDTAQVCAIIDRRGYRTLTYLILPGTLADANATFAVTMEHGDNSALSDTAAVAATDVTGTLANSGFIFSDDSEPRKIGYIGGKRYTRLTITPTGNTGAAPLAVLALLGDPVQVPTANPPI
jgi:hypothetical protein